MPIVHASDLPCPPLSDLAPERCSAHRSDRPDRHRGSPTAVDRTESCDALRADTSDRRWPRSGPYGPLRFAAVAGLILVSTTMFRPAAAAFVPFENCLSESYVNNVPAPLQWVPMFVDASFDTTNPKHTLRVTAWGNVTGSSTNVPLPPSGSPDWADPGKTDGKILDLPEPNVPDPKVTTLHSKIEVLTYEPWSENTNFCNTSLTNASCPLGPVFHEAGSSLLLPYDLPSVTMSNDFYSTYAFTSFSATFLIIYGDVKGTNIGCVSASVTPDLGDLTWMLTFLPLAVLLFVGAATVFAGIFSPWGAADIFHWSSNYGRDPDLLRLVTPGFGDCLQYIQFVVLTGGLTLSYPGYYQPIVSQGSWSALMFNQSFVSKDLGWNSVQDGIYITDGVYGLHKLAQLAGMANVEDIWVGMMIWLLGIIGAMFVLFHAGFFGQWLYRYIKRIPEEDLRSKNIPFTVGNVVRIVLNYFLLPIVALSTFQLVVASDSPAYTVVLAVITLVIIIGFTAWLLYLIATTKPRAFLFDDLPTLLLYGPLYNTYSDEAAAFTLIPVLLTFVRGIAIGAVQLAGVAQVVLLAICEVIQILTLHAFRPFHSPTSMNAYHTLFSVLRLITVLLMVAFIPSLGVTEGPKGWIGYAILVTHAGVLLLGFLLNAVQTIVEVLARMLGAGGDDIRGQSRGGLSKIFGMRQLSRRMSRRDHGPSRQSQLSSSAMLDTDEVSKAGYIMPSGRVRSESAGSVSIPMHHRHRSSSGLEYLSLDAPLRNPDYSVASSFTPTTAGEASTFSFLPSPKHAARREGTFGMQTPDPYYRPPRQRRSTLENSPPQAAKTASSWSAGEWHQKRLSQGGTGTTGDPAELGTQISRDATPAPYAVSFTPRTDYSTREVDFYYGVRGQRLNSDAPSRKLGTGPADPTGPMASAAGWFREKFFAKRKDKGKGFEVVRSSRMPPAMRAGGGDFEDEAPPAGIPVAMGVLRNGPIESDEEDEGRRNKGARATGTMSPEREPLNHGSGPRTDEADDVGTAGTTGAPTLMPEIATDMGVDESNTATQSDGNGDLLVPDVPRKSSKRASWNSPHAKAASLSQQPEAGQSTTLAPSAIPASRLPFERTPSQKRLSGSSAGLTDELTSVDLQDRADSTDGRPPGYGYVSQGSISRVDHEVDLLGSSAEVVDERR
ncbi:putative flavin carrier protein 3 [Madurella mycetomatis]|uniref:Flavin carrier protein 3 n=1 Tax=Madurella mycetomatis TaxID=100816 RepID=A0A175WF64_9PEZI|nr:putative flavin carrier protein 3 [Madurella mycetomatis]